MGFRRNIGSTRTCRVRNGYIEIEDSNVTYPTTIPVDTDWQCNMFESPVVSLLTETTFTSELSMVQLVSIGTMDYFWHCTRGKRLTTVQT